jgi:2-hydroxy-6-oxonona-2,4-dienedioate hydrolase
MTNESITFESTSKTVATARGSIHYHDVGRGDPLVFIHGSGPGVSGWANFEGNLATFSRHFRCLVPDLPGFGSSEANGEHPVVHGHDAIVRVLDELGIERASIIGNSLGGGVGAKVAAKHPDRVSKLVSIGGVGINLLSPAPSEGIKLLVAFVEDPTRARLVEWMESMVFDRAILTDELIDRRLAQATRPEIAAEARKMYSRAGLPLIRQSRNGIGASTSIEHFAHIAAPTLLLWGRDDRVSPLDMALVPMRLIPKCELHVFYDCGHWVMIERRAEFDSAVLAFLAR